MEGNCLCQGCWNAWSGGVRGSWCLSPARLLAQPPAREAKLLCSVAPCWYTSLCQVPCMLRCLVLSARDIYKLAHFCNRVAVRMWMAVDLNVAVCTGETEGPGGIVWQCPSDLGCCSHPALME